VDKDGAEIVFVGVLVLREPRVIHDQLKGGHFPCVSEFSASILWLILATKAVVALVSWVNAERLD
jgi:hypothetical protein